MCKCFFNIQSSRFKSKESHTPGPGAYNLQKRSDWLKEKYAQNEMLAEMQVEEGMKDGSVGEIQTTGLILTSYYYSARFLGMLGYNTKFVLILKIINIHSSTWMYRRENERSSFKMLSDSNNIISDYLTMMNWPKII